MPCRPADISGQHLTPIGTVEHKRKAAQLNEVHENLNSRYSLERNRGRHDKRGTSDPGVHHDHLSQLNPPVYPSTQPPRSLRINFAWTLAGNVIYAGTQWGILVLLARLGTPATVGQFSLGLAITAPIMLFASLQLRAVEATDAQRLFGFSHYAGLRLLTTVAAISVILAISTVAYRGDIALVIAAFALSKGIESLSDVIYGLWQQQERMELIAKSLILRGLLALVLSGICFASFGTVWAAVCGIAAAWGVVFAVYDMPHAIPVAATTDESIVPSFSIASMKNLFRVSLPLGIVAMLVSLNINVPRYVIYHVEGVRELGIFSAVGYLGFGQSSRELPRTVSNSPPGSILFRGASRRLPTAIESIDLYRCSAGCAGSAG